MFGVSVQNKFVNGFFLFPVKGKRTFSLSVEGLSSEVMDSFLLFSNYVISGFNICLDSVASFELCYVYTDDSSFIRKQINF